MRRLLPALALVLAACATVQASPRADAAPKISTGAVEVRTGIGPDPTIVIAIDEAREGQRDGMADAAYVYYTESSVPRIRHVFDVAVVEDFGDRIIVSGSGKRLIFALRDAKAIPARTNDLGTFTDGIGIGRYSDGHVTGMRVSSEADASTSRPGCDGPDSGECYSDWSLGGGASGANCPSGGPGTISCTASCPGFSCSASCTPGYYACCACTSCKCVRG
ncbi:MAG TPA: hypothetical protein VF846_22095 [Thermoanaerobaculia bacterium]|jgi:hypothetical protein